MLLSYKNHKPIRYKSQVKQPVSEASGSILVVDVVEPDLHDLDLRLFKIQLSLIALLHNAPPRKTLPVFFILEIQISG